MNRVILQPDGQLKTETRDTVQQPLACLGHQVQLDPGCRLRSYFEMLEKYPVLMQLGAFYDHILDQYRRCPADGCLWEAFEHLELAKTVEMIGYPGSPRLEIYNVFHGVNQTQHCEIRSLAMEFLLDMPLRLGRLKHVVFGDNVDTFDFDTVYTLFEFIDSIAWELSFHGTPAQCNI
ncbi:MAG: hypothetical protein P8Z73_13530 [Desulfobacteraceae bacterium]|jgi:hypothetical protein